MHFGGKILFAFAFNLSSTPSGTQSVEMRYYVAATRMAEAILTSSSGYENYLLRIYYYISHCFTKFLLI